MPNSKRSLNTVYISERVQECFLPIARCPFTAIIAPMGYGKTTAVNWYLAARVQSENALVIRVSIYEDSLPVFWKRVQDAASAAGLAFLTERAMPTDALSASLLADDLCRSLAGGRPTYLFLDDFHLLTDERVASFLCSLACRLPDNVHIIAASRDRFLRGADIVRLGSRLYRIGTEQLRLNHTELSVYSRRCGAALSEAQIDELLRSTEGWFSAVYLNLCSFAERDVLADNRSDIYEMFASALIDPLNAREKEFLSVMSQADEFTTDMAVFVTGMDGVPEMLAAFTEQNAFVTRLPGGGGYRFHHMLKACAGSLFAHLPEDARAAYLKRFGCWYERRGQFWQALDAYRESGDHAAWLHAIAEDAGITLASMDPAEIEAELALCPPETVRADPRAILVLMRRMFSWGKYKEMFALQKLLLDAIRSPGLTEEERGNLSGECDLIMSFLSYNDIAGMSELHRSACRKMTRPALSIGTYGSFTFGSPSVLMMFHRMPGGIAEELRTMNDAMPYYYRVTENHGAGAELVMDAEASFLRGDFGAARLLNARARCRASENKQLFLLLCCDFLALRLALAEGGDASLSESEEALLRQRRDATLLLSLDAAHAYAAALDDRPERIPPRFADHMLESVNILRPARPMLLMIENQAYLAQKQYEAVVGRSDTHLALCREMHYALTELHVRIQTAAAYWMLGRSADARSLLTEALALAEPDGILMPFAENFRLLETPLEMLAKENAAARRAASLGAQWKAGGDARRARNAPGEPAACLTERETEIARLAAARATNREIAEKLYLSEGTVKQYINQIYAKLHIDGDTRTKRQRLADTLRKN